MKAGIDPHRDAEQQGETGGDEAELEGRRQALGDEFGNRPRILVGEAEIALRGMADETGVRPTPAELLTPVNIGIGLAEHTTIFKRV